MPKILRCLWESWW